MDDLERYLNQFIANNNLQSLEAEEQKTDDGGSTTTTAAAAADGNESRTCSTCSVPPEVLETPEDHRIILTVQNVISSVKLSCRLDLDFITRTAWNTEYKPERFRALIMRIREPRTTANIYQSGSLVCTGARSIDESHRAARRFARILQKLGFPVSFQNFKIHNMVVSCNTFPVVLEALNLVYHQHCSYEPELFPALFFKMVPGITAIVFVQGKLILSGAKSPAEVSEALQVIYPVLRRFMKH